MRNEIESWPLRSLVVVSQAFNLELFKSRYGFYGLKGGNIGR